LKSHILDMRLKVKELKIGYFRLNLIKAVKFIAQRLS